jgi:hypothetical protein
LWFKIRQESDGMRLHVIKAFMVSILLTCSAHANIPEEGNLGVGAMVGTIGAISGKYWLTSVDALDAGIEFLDHPWTVIYVDYYRHFPGLFGGKSRFGRETSPYVLVGTGMGFWDRTDNCGRWNCSWNPNSTGTGNGFFVRLDIGLEWFLRATRFSLFGEFGPSYMWYPTSGNTFDVAIGGRFYF